MDQPILLYSAHRPSEVASVASYEAAQAVSRLFGDELIVTRRDRRAEPPYVRLIRGGAFLELPQFGFPV